MDPTIFPTKGNLILARNTLALAKQGYELLDKKRNILVREMMLLIDRAKQLQISIDVIFRDAYKALEIANINMGISTVEQICHATVEENSLSIKNRSIMGVAIPIIEYERKESRPAYGFFRTTSALDEAFIHFNKVKNLTVELGEIENAVYRLAVNIKQTQKRANALKNILIPRYTQVVYDISSSLEEKDREEFARLKVIKKKK